ncbi:MAG: ATP synthase subunit C [Acutalibacteraceae bacterium]|nr:ATP synthase subunit C [Acutalibacteraceae bacterium]
MEFSLLLLPIIFIIASALVTKKAVSRGAKRKKSVALQILSFAAVLICCTVFPLVAGATGSPEAAEAAATAVATQTNGLGLLACALSTGVACVGAGIAVAGAAPAAIGATSEDPKAFGKALIFVVLGEGVAIYGMLISILIYTKC